MIPHGESKYKNHGCRCEVCTKEHRYKMQKSRKERAERLRKDPSLAYHGSASTYANWLCRCRPCTNAHYEYKKEDE